MTSIGPIARSAALAGDSARATAAAPHAATDRIVIQVPALLSTHQPQDRRYANSRPDPGFVAHLIATAEGAPQTRTVRRATAQETVSRYSNATGQLTGAATGQHLSRLV